jgi:Tn3 transposase DDE domain
MRFVARSFRLRDLQREIKEGLNVVEAWNRATSIIRYGNSGGFATNRHDQQEPCVLALHLPQAALGSVNTPMIQDLLAEPEWAGMLTREDKRALTPLFWTHVSPYGEVDLTVASRLAMRALEPCQADRGNTYPQPSAHRHAPRPGPGPSPRGTCRLMPRSLTTPLMCRSWHEGWERVGAQRKRSRAAGRTNAAAPPSGSPGSGRGYA